jgi:hypothetical protein
VLIGIRASKLRVQDLDLLRDDTKLPWPDVITA